MSLSALRGDGVARFWSVVESFHAKRSASGGLAERRTQQALAWMGQRIDAGLKQAFHSHPAVRNALPQLRRQVALGTVAPSAAARSLLALAGLADVVEGESP
jgi:LAO/AO transport system kinase